MPDTPIDLLRPCQIEETRPPTCPWPIVDECHSDFRPDHSCPQSDGSHDHQWKAWHGAPKTETGSVVGYMSGPGIPVRCRVCGGRKCDTATCLLRRNHGGDCEHF